MIHIYKKRVLAGADTECVYCHAKIGRGNDARLLNGFQDGEYLEYFAHETCPCNDAINVFAFDYEGLAMQSELQHV